jgi:pSer/pThr/pTyr-binding forkhead associated (FHA) protein
VIADVSVDEALLALKIAFLVLLYLFIWLVVRSATRDLQQAPQESIVLRKPEADALRAAAVPSASAAAEAETRPRLRVLHSPSLQTGAEVELSAPTSVGRSADNGLRIDGDDFVSSRHARFEVRPDGVWVEDAGSTNGTFVNGARVTTARQLRRGDVVRIGQTDLRMES